jgi:hypothetical protein
LVATGKYLMQQRIAKRLPMFLRRHLKGSVNVAISVDTAPTQAYGKDSLWPLFDVLDQLGEWLDTDQLKRDYDQIMRSKADSRPLRRLQAVQTIATRFLI